MDTEPPADPAKTRRTTRFGLALAAILFAGASASWLLNDEASPEDASLREAASPIVLTVPESPVTAAAAAPQAGPAETNAADEIQVCGGSWVKAGADGTPDAEEYRVVFLKLGDEAAAIAVAAMTASGSPRAQAAALYLQAGRASLADAAPYRDALARLARESNDPRVYVWAYRACQSAPEAARGECAFIQVEQWIRLDPGNSEPWLASAAQARSRKDSAAVDDAMFHIAAAERHDPEFGALAAEVLDHLPTSDDLLLGAEALTAQAMGIDAGYLPAYAPLFQYCASTELHDANRRELCERMADGMAQRSTTMLGRMMGVDLGKRVGWAPERIEALEQQRDAEGEAMARLADLGGDRSRSCSSVRASLDRLRDVGRSGELEALRRQIAATGIAVPELAAKGRLRAAVMKEKASREEAAASAASAVSASVVAAALPR